MKINLVLKKKYQINVYWRHTYHKNTLFQDSSFFFFFFFQEWFRKAFVKKWEYNNFKRSKKNTYMVTPVGRMFALLFFLPYRIESMSDVSKPRHDRVTNDDFGFSEVYSRLCTYISRQDRFGFSFFLSVQTCVVAPLSEPLGDIGFIRWT